MTRPRDEKAKNNFVQKTSDMGGMYGVEHEVGPGARKLLYNFSRLNTVATHAWIRFSRVAHYKRCRFGETDSPPTSQRVCLLKKAARMYVHTTYAHEAEALQPKEIQVAVERNDTTCILRRWSLCGC